MLKKPEFGRNDSHHQRVLLPKVKSVSPQRESEGDQPHWSNKKIYCSFNFHGAAATTQEGVLIHGAGNKRCRSSEIFLFSGGYYANLQLQKTKKLSRLKKVLVRGQWAAMPVLINIMGKLQSTNI